VFRKQELCNLFINITRHDKQVPDGSGGCLVMFSFFFATNFELVSNLLDLLSHDDRVILAYLGGSQLAVVERTIVLVGISM